MSKSELTNTIILLLLISTSIFGIRKNLISRIGPVELKANIITKRGNEIYISKDGDPLTYYKIDPIDDKIKLDNNEEIRATELRNITYTFALIENTIIIHKRFVNDDSAKIVSIQHGIGFNTDDIIFDSRGNVYRNYRRYKDLLPKTFTEAVNWGENISIRDVEYIGFFNPHFPDLLILKAKNSEVSIDNIYKLVYLSDFASTSKGYVGADLEFIIYDNWKNFFNL